MKIAVIVRRLSGKGGMETVIKSLAAAALQHSEDRIEVWAMGKPLDGAWLANPNSEVKIT